MKISGLDIGTTGCKLTVFDEQGHQLGMAYREYPVSRDESGHEISFEDMMDSIYAVISEMAAQHPDIAWIGVTSFGEAFVMTDEKGYPLHRAMLYTDQRGTRECAALTAKIGEKQITEITGLRPHEMYSISKMIWIREHKPEVYAAARHIFLAQDYVVWQLTHCAQIDCSLASRTMAFDIRKLEWSREIFEVAGIDVSLMSTPVPTGTVAGTITKETGRRTGLGNGCKIVSVSHDQVAAGVGSGAFDGSVAVDGAGTVECLTPIYNRLPDIEIMSRSFFSVVPYAIPGKYVAYAFLYTGGALIQWCIDILAKIEKQDAEKAGISVNRYLEEQYGRDEPTGLIVLPYFAGAATPYMDNGAKGAILGMTLNTDIPTIYRACMEGVAYEMRVNYEALRDSGFCPVKLNATGGGARSRVWMQMKADILNLPITALRTADAGTVGSAMLTGVAAGLFQDIETAASLMGQETETYQPRPEMHRKYMGIYERYKAVYAAVRPLV